MTAALHCCMLNESPQQLKDADVTHLLKLKSVPPWYDNDWDIQFLPVVGEIFAAVDLYKLEAESDPQKDSVKAWFM